jgi:glycosyltransferase involved in cell wall biosynthesis
MSASRRSQLRKVVIVNTADEGGGAERISMAMLDGFAAKGIETWLLVGDKKTDHPHVMPFFLSPYFNYRHYGAWNRLALLEVRRKLARWLGLEDHNHPYTHQILRLTGSPPDLVICHNLHGGFFDLRALLALSARVPVVLRLFDCWLFTGHCAYPFGCLRWQTGCGRCPDLAIPPAIRRDATRINWWRKRRALGRARFYASAESNWMLERARQSLLAPAVGEWKLIRGGVDLQTFVPGPRLDARRELGLDPTGFIAVFVANHGDLSALKDFGTIRQALAELAVSSPDIRLQLVSIGGMAKPDERISSGISMRQVGYIRSSTRLASYYRAADFMVHSSLEEAFGLCVAEALACGLPVISASHGGVHEIVAHEQNGLLVAPRNPLALADAITRLLDDPARLAAMGEAAAAGRGTFDRQTMVDQMHAWCTDIVERRRA